MATSKDPKAVAEEKARRKAKAAEKKLQDQARLRAELTGHLETAKSTLAEASTQLQEARSNLSSHKALVSHLAGFYAEIDKLSKNKGVFESTDLAVQTINEVVRDAKRFAAGDPYLDRTKEFVPAGQNPPYSDVLLVARTVQQFLQRSQEALMEREKQFGRAVREAQTVVAALTLWIESGRDVQPTKSKVAEVMEGTPANGWFFEAQDGEEYFNHERLTKHGVFESASAE